MSLYHLYLAFDGRIRRSTYFLKGWLPITVLYLLIAYLDTVIFQTEFGEPSAFMCLPVLILAYISLALGIKRAHDLNHSGWFLLWGFIPFIGSINYAVFYMRILSTVEIHTLLTIKNCAVFDVTAKAEIKIDSCRSTGTCPISVITTKLFN